MRRIGEEDGIVGVYLCDERVEGKLGPRPVLDPALYHHQAGLLATESKRELIAEPDQTSSVPAAIRVIVFGVVEILAAIQVVALLGATGAARVVLGLGLAAVLIQLTSMAHDAVTENPRTDLWAPESNDA